MKKTDDALKDFFHNILSTDMEKTIFNLIRIDKKPEEILSHLISEKNILPDKGDLKND